MITVISATNRPNSNTFKVVKNYVNLLKKEGVIHNVFSFQDLPSDIAFAELYGNRSDKFKQLLEKFIIPAQKIVIVSPEYNGSFPGILKVFLDAVPPDTNRNKKVALVGVSNGRAGNLRGMDHLTGVLNYLGMHVLPNKLPISSVSGLLDEAGTIKDENTIRAMEKHIAEFLKW